MKVTTLAFAGRSRMAFWKTAMCGLAKCFFSASTSRQRSVMRMTLASLSSTEKV